MNEDSFSKKETSLNERKCSLTKTFNADKAPAMEMAKPDAIIRDELI